MKIRLVLLQLSLAAALLSAGSLAAEEGPRPSRHMRHAFQMFLLLEEKMERLEWDAALGVGHAVRAEVLSRREEMTAAAGAKRVDDFLYDFGTLLKGIQAKSYEESLPVYREAERRLFEIYDFFDFRVHPVCAIIDAEIHEALEYVQRGNLSAAVVEMEEVTLYFKTARDILAARGRPGEELESLSREIERVTAHLRAGDARDAAEGLAGLAESTAQYLVP